MKKSKKKVPLTPQLLVPVYRALIELGGSGTNTEIRNRVSIDLNLTEEQIDESHLGKENTTELEYQLAWARTRLRKYGVIESIGRAVWAITPKYNKESIKLDPVEIMRCTSNKYNKNKDDNCNFQVMKEQERYVETPEELSPWREELLDTLLSMDPYGFERLTQRLLRECGFDQVEVTKRSGDGGIDGFGKLRINGIFSFNVAFQCKRYRKSVSPAEIRDFRGAITTDVEKAIFVTTGIFTKNAREEASNPGKRQIDLIDGNDFIDKLIEYQIGVKPVTIYEIDRDFFDNI